MFGKVGALVIGVGIGVGIGLLVAPNVLKLTILIPPHYPCRLGGMKRQIAALQAVFILVRRGLLGRLSGSVRGRRCLLWPTIEDLDFRPLA